MIRAIKSAIAAPFVAAFGMDVVAEIDHALDQLPNPPENEREAIDGALETAGNLQRHGFYLWGERFMDSFEDSVEFHHARFQREEQ